MCPQTGYNIPWRLFRTHKFPEGIGSGTFCGKKESPKSPKLFFCSLESQTLVIVPSGPDPGEPGVRAGGLVREQLRFCRLPRGSMGGGVETCRDGQVRPTSEPEVF